eukprot:m.1568132 g.1568132  ORF g.1568132 m.1568132 type:complete len:108 (-) comp25295_c0_seq54:2961-3284(-)
MFNQYRGCYLDISHFVYVHTTGDSTMVSPFAILFFGGDLVVDHSKGTIAADGWLKMSAPGRIAVLVNQLRKGVDLALIKKIDNPAVDIQQDACIQALVTMLRTEGDL